MLDISCENCLPATDNTHDNIKLHFSHKLLKSQTVSPAAVVFGALYRISYNLCHGVTDRWKLTGSSILIIRYSLTLTFVIYSRLSAYVLR